MTAAIEIDNLSKKYVVCHERKRGAYRTLRETLSELAAAPLAMLRRSTPRTSEEFWALRDVNVEVPQGQVLGIIGRNGAGKSTLLKILSRITKPTFGRVEMNGRLGSLLEVGTGFHPELTGRENIYLNGSILGMRKREIDARFDEIVAFAEIEQFLDTPVKRYSSGMYVRLAFAVAANLEPEILVIDEVLAVGDAAFQRKCLGKMEDVVHDGRTVIFVSHNMAAIRSLCTRCVALDGGRVVRSGDVGECIDAYCGALTDRVTASRTLPYVPEKHAQITKVELCNGDGTPTAGFRYGDELTVRVHYRAAAPTRWPHLGLVIASVSGDRVLNSNMHYIPFDEPSRASRSGVIDCALGAVPLMAGEYLVSLWLDVRGAEADVLHDVIGFHVSESDPWGTGKLPPRQASLLWWPAKFTVETGA